MASPLPSPGLPAPTECGWSLRGKAFGGLQWGTPTEPLVLLHGFLDHAGGWDRVARRLGRGSMALDHRGHGRSAWVGPGETYHFAEYVADLDALVDALGGRVRLVGHSMGGTVASVYAGARPDRVAALVVLDGLGLPDGGAGARTRMVEFLDGARAPRPERVMVDEAEAAMRLTRAYPGLDAEFARELAQRGTRPVPGGLAWAYDPRHRSRSAVPYRQDQHQRFLEAIRCPVLSIHPEHSPFAVEDVARVEACIPDLRLATVAGAGHMLPLDAPEAVASLIEEFLQAN